MSGDGSFAEPGSSQAQANTTPITPSEQAQASGADANETRTPQAWNTKRFREDYELAKSRLADPKFTMTDYPDPLLPRDETRAKLMAPSNFPPDVEEQLKSILAASKDA